MSRFGIVPALDVKQLGASHDDAMNRLLTALQEAIKQVQNVAELGGTAGLTEDTPEACCLCEHLDRVFLYGLREPQWGYWPWVRQFTHPAAQREITGCSCLSTELGYGRAWLLASLNGALLEGYMRSFRQNQRLLHKGYSASSFLRHPQHLELLATVVSGLEHVPFKLNPNNPLLDDTSAWWKLAQLWLATGELPQGFSGMTVSSSASSASSSSCREEDSGIHSASLASPAEEVPEPCHCADCVALGDRERIRRIISMDVGLPADDPDEAGGDLEVTRVVLTRRRRGGRAGRGPPGRGPACGGEDSAGPAAEPEGTQAVPAPEATPDAPVGAATPAPGALPAGLAPWERTSDTEGFAGTSPCARDSGCFELTEEDRGAPDGCEGGGLHEAPLAREEMFSIYDGHGKGASGLSALKEEPVRPCSPEEQTPVASPLGEEELPTETGSKEGLDIEVENCALLYLTLQVFGSEDEKLYKAFLAWQWAAEGQLEPAYVVLTNECLYTLQPGPEVNQFACDRRLRFSQLEVVTVWLNYQGFSLTCASGDRLELATGHAELTRNILSSLDVAIRRNRQALPSVVGHCSEQLDALQRLLASELKPQGGELLVRDYRLVHWEQRAQRGPSSCPGGPSASGPLMWRFLEDPSARAHRRRKGQQWQAGHFLLRAGVLYRFANQGDSVADATYLVSGFPGASCGAVSSVGRPHALQLGLSSSGACLQLAASNQGDLERWVRALSEAQHHCPAARSVGCVAACCLVLAGDLVLTLVEGHSRVLGRGAVVDLSAVHSEASFCVLEFESGEAERKSCSAHSWLFWFATTEEKEQFLAVVSACWQEIFQVSLDVLPLSNGSLRNHCLARASQLERRLTELKEFCLDS